MPIRNVPSPFAMVALAAVVISTACGRNRNDTAAQNDSASHAATSSGSVVPTSDTTGGAISAVTPAVGPGIQVTSTDEHNVSRSFDLKLTEDNWKKFMRAADSVAALRTRDPEVRQHLDQQIVGAKDDDAGLRWLEANPKVVAAITSAGLSPKDYYRLGITIAAASRFMDNPPSAPPTPAARENAELVSRHRADLTHLQALAHGGTSPVRAQ